MRAFKRLVGTAFVTVVAVISLNKICPCAEAASNAAQANHASAPAVITPITVNVISPPKSKDEAADDKADRNERAQTDWWAIHLTGLLALIGFVQTITFWMQARRLKQTIGKMDETAEKQLRAYLHAVPRINIAELKPDGKLTLRCFVRNAGQTPGTNVEVSGAVAILPHPAPDPFPADFHTQDMSRTVVASGENTYFETEAARSFSAEEIQAVKTGANCRLYYYGKITYRDIFGIDRQTTFRAEHGGHGDAGKAFISSRGGNEAT